MGFLFLILYPAAPPPPPPPPPPPFFHTPSFTHIFVNHQLWLVFVNHRLSHPHLCQPPSVTHIFVTHHLSGTWRHPPSFHVAGVALRALGWLWWRAWTGLVAGDAAALCVAGVALGDIRLTFTWQAWHLVTSTFVLRDRRAAYLGWLSWRSWTGLVAGDATALCVAGVALGDIHLRFAWDAWHLVTSTFV